MKKQIITTAAAMAVTALQNIGLYRYWFSSWPFVIYDITGHSCADSAEMGQIGTTDTDADGTAGQKRWR